MLSFKAFVEELLHKLEIPQIENLNEDTGIYTELGMDSLEAFELIYVTQTMAGFDSTSDVPPIFTLGDAYAYYVSLTS